MTTLAVGVVAPNVLAACFGGAAKQAEKAKPPQEAALTFRPGDNAKNVLPTAPISVEVRDGWFQHVALTNPDGKVVAGVLNRDRTLYTLTEPLGYDVTYTWSGAAVGHDGKPVAVKGKITTVAPTKVVDGGFQLADGQTVGRRGADHHPVRRADLGQSRRRAGVEGDHRTAGRGQLGVAARRSRRRPRALAHP